MLTLQQKYLSPHTQADIKPQQRMNVHSKSHLIITHNVSQLKNCIIIAIYGAQNKKLNKQNNSSSSSRKKKSQRLNKQ